MAAAQRAGGDRRAEERWNLKAPLALYARDSSNFIGHVVNVSLRGMLVLSEETLVLEQPLEVDLEIPGAAGKWEKTPITVIGLRATEDEATGSIYTGFRFEQVPAQAVFALQRLVDELSSIS